MQAQDTSEQRASSEAKGLPPRAAPTDYQFHVQAGKLAIGAELTGHSLPTSEGPLTTQDYVGVELGLYGPAGTRLVISPGDFTLRLNKKKSPIDSQPYGMIVSSLKDPEWIPPDHHESKSKTGLSSGQGGDSSGPPPPVKIPIAVQRNMAQRVQKAALPEGDRPLPQAGLLFFPHHGKTDNLRFIELIYNGPAGKATLKLQP